MGIDIVVEQGITAFKQGDKKTARHLLISALRRDPNDVKAWSWLYNVAETDNQRIQCLRQVVRINPTIQKARTKLIQLETKPRMLNRR